MANLTLCGIREGDQVRSFLDRYSSGVGLRRWFNPKKEHRNAFALSLLQTLFSAEIEREKRAGGFEFSDVVEIQARANASPEVLAFQAPHWHEENELRMIVSGGGRFSFYSAPDLKTRLMLDVGPGELVSIPAHVEHSFEPDEQRGVIAIRLFTKSDGWVPHYCLKGDRQENDKRSD